MSEFIITCDEETASWIGNDVGSMRPLVRCRDCKYYEPVPEDPGDWCGYWTDRVYGADGYCAWGVKRKEDGE